MFVGDFHSVFAAVITDIIPVIRLSTPKLKVREKFSLDSDAARPYLNI
jgi:hypothetical protein